MGYTVYWHLPADEEGIRKVQEALPAILEDFRRLMPFLPPLAGPEGEGEPLLSEAEVAFNGVGEDAHEPFLFFDWRALTDPLSPGFAFCKTARKPYDLAVKAFLLAARKRLGHLLRFSCDGDASDWEEAGALVARLF